MVCCWSFVRMEMDGVDVDVDVDNDDDGGLLNVVVMARMMFLVLCRLLLLLSSLFVVWWLSFLRFLSRLAAFLSGSLCWTVSRSVPCAPFRLLPVWHFKIDSGAPQNNMIAQAVWSSLRKWKPTHKCQKAREEKSARASFCSSYRVYIRNTIRQYPYDLRWIKDTDTSAEEEETTDQHGTQTDELRTESIESNPESVHQREW